MHGGPGAGPEDQEPLETLAGRRRRVILYNPPGCGNPDHSHAPEIWTVELIVEEVEETIR